MSSIPCFRSLLLAMFCCCLASCGSGNRLGIVKHDEKLVPVEGTVLFEGQPAKNATVVFVRQGSTGSLQVDGKAPPNPHGECDEAGKFKLMTYMAIDGAPIGSYTVSVSWKDPEGQSREGETYPELLPQFVDPATSGLIAEVKPGPNVLKPFELKQ